jgi:hypothetical protein
VACLPVAGLAMVIGTGSASAARTPANTKAAAVAALEHLLKGVHSTNHAVRGPLSITAPAQSKSTNWAGYADTGSKFTKISGTWTEPAVKCGSAQALAVFWVGIDGFNSQTVEQDGTLAFCQGGGAAPQYFTWWEMFPSNSIQLVGKTVKPGDHFAASVVRTGTKYALKVTDSTRGGNSFTKNKTCAAATCKDTSAEWIAEAPTSSGSIVPLPNFGTWTGSNSAVSGGGKSGTIKSFADTEITMVNNGGKVKAQPGPLNAKGNQFKVTWKSST